MSFDTNKEAIHVGYARVSTTEQHLDLQLDAFKRAGCGKYFTDKVSGAKTARPRLDEALAYLREGDTLVVWQLDRLGRSLKHLIETVTSLHKRNIGFRSLTENIDTTTPTGKLIFHVFDAIAEFERDLNRERTHAGLEAAWARGRVGGRPKKLNSASKIALARKLFADKTNTIADICNTLHISRATLYRYVKPGLV